MMQYRYPPRNFFIPRHPMHRQINAWLNKRKHKKRLPSGPITVTTTEEGLANHAYFLSYVMPRKLWNRFMARGKHMATYSSVLDPLRVYQVYKDTPPQAHYFRNNLDFYKALKLMRERAIEARDLGQDPRFNQKNNLDKVILRFVGSNVRKTKQPSREYKKPQKEPSIQGRTSKSKPNPPQEPPSLLEQKEQDVYQAFQNSIAAKEKILPLPTGEETVVVSEMGLQNHAYFLSYKMPRQVWNFAFQSGGSVGNYLKVLDPDRVRAVYGKKGPDFRIFSTIPGLYHTLLKLTPDAEDDPIDPDKTLEQFMKQDARYSFPPSGQEVKETQLEDVLREASSQKASFLANSNHAEQYEILSAQHEDSSHLAIHERRTDPVDYLKAIRDPFEHGLYLSYIVDEQAWRKELDKAKKTKTTTQANWEEILDPLRVKDYYIYGPGTVFLRAYEKDPGLGNAMNSVLNKYYETHNLPIKEETFLAKYPFRPGKVDIFRTFKDPFNLAHYLSVEIIREDLRKLIANAKENKTERETWMLFMDPTRVKEYYADGNHILLLESFQGNEELFFALRDNKLLSDPR